MRIIIIGAGTAGYSAAAALSHNKKLNISLIEPTDIPTIGVGESTLPLINEFHKKFDIFSDLQWLENSHGTMKFTIDFRNFTTKKNSVWSHPFYVNPDLEKIHILDNLNLTNEELTDKLFYTQKLKNTGFKKNNQDISNLGAYHFDASLYVKELKQVALSRNVQILNNKIIKINQNNNITQNVILDNGNTLEADLYIDCTGFKNILFENLNSKFTSFTDRLFCDSAITIRLPYINEEIQKVNATLCHALDNGWVWHTSLEGTLAVGYVFSSQHTNADAATIELKTYLTEIYGYESKDLHHNVVKFRSGSLEKSWIGNNISIGLSSFFIEPIESTGIALFQAQIIELNKILETNMQFATNYRALYNKTIKNKIFAVKDFIEMHYILSDRDDSQFWIDAKSITPNATQKKFIDLYKEKEFEEIMNSEIEGIFGSLSWFLLLLGMDTKSI